MLSDRIICKDVARTHTIIAEDLARMHTVVVYSNMNIIIVFTFEPGHTHGLGRWIACLFACMHEDGTCVSQIINSTTEVIEA